MDDLNDAPPHQPADDVPFRRRVTFILGAVLLLIAAVLVFWFEVRVLLLGFAGVILGVFLYVPSDWLARRLIARFWLCLLGFGVLLLALLAGCAWLVQSRVSRQVDDLQQQLPTAWGQVRHSLQQHGWGRWLVGQAQDKLESAQQANLAGPGIKVVSHTGAVLAELFVVLFVGLFLAINPQLYVRGSMRLVPRRHRRRARALFTDCGRLIWWWLIGQLLAMAFIGIVTGVTVWLLGLPMALTLGLLAAVLNFIPNFGPLAAAVPAVLLALVQGPMTAAWVALAYTGIQLLQNHVVTPLVQQEAVKLPPVVMILAQVFMYYWAGLLGMALAPPLAALVILLVQKLYVQVQLGDPMQKGEGFWPEDAGGG
jgi:predicted PurR-regulated permease PerM